MALETHATDLPASHPLLAAMATAFAAAPQAIVLLWQTGRIYSVNSLAAALLPAPPVAAPQPDFASQLLPEQRAEWAAALSVADAVGVAAHGELIVGKRTVAVYIVSLRDAAGALAGYCVTLSDPEAPAERERALRAALAERERQLEHYAANIPELIAYVGADRRYLFVNEAFAKVHGKSRAEIVGRTLAELHGDAHAHVSEPLLRRVLAGKEVSYERRVRGAGGDERWMRTRMTPDIDSNGVFLGHYVVDTDIHELKLAVKTREAHARMTKELEIAARLQASVLPKAPLRHARVHTHATIIPAFEVGGDLYDYWLLDDDTLVMVIADVSGKGTPAALFMAMTRTLLRASDARLLDKGLGTFVEHVNDYLSAENDQAMFVTAWLGVLRLSTGVLNYVNAGHNRPVYMSRATAQFMEPPKSMALAALEGTPYVAGQRTMQPGDVLVLYTDGVTEATSAGKQLFGDDALLATLAEPVAPARIPDLLVDAVRQHEAGAPQADDITVLVVEYRASGSEHR